MCSELLLALLYFSTILFINYFLYKLILNYIKSIFYLLKIKNIFNFSKKTSKNIFVFLHFYSNQDFKTQQVLKNVKQFSKIEDILLIGNIHKSLNNLINKSQQNKTYFFKLLENQYLSKPFNLK